MSSVIWPNDFQRILNEEWGGEFVVFAPFTYARTKRGPSYFHFDCKSAQGVHDLRYYLRSELHISFPIIDLHRDKPLAENKNHLGLNILKEAAQGVLIQLIQNKQHIQSLLDRSLEVERETKKVREGGLIEPFSKSTAQKFQEIFGYRVGQDSVYCEELSAMAFHVLSDNTKINEAALSLPNGLSLMHFILPPQSPDGYMFVLKKEGKFGIADDEEKKGLIEEYNKVLAARQSMLKIPPEDRYFDKQSVSLVTVPAGTILNWLKTGDANLSRIGGATYWNPNEGAYYAISEHNVGNALKADPKLTVGLLATITPELSL